jgi:predicted nucleic acid-binding protein
MTYLLDTCIITELISGNPDPKLITWIDSQPEEMIYISVLTLAELKQSIESEPSSRKRAAMNEWLTNDLVARFSGRISEITTEVTLKWGELATRIHEKGFLISPLDSLNLAIAMLNGHTLVTKEKKHFEGLDVHLVNPCSLD